MSAERGAHLAACLAHVLGTDPADVPVPAGADPAPAWRSWLAGRGLGLVPIAGAARFSWAGHWIALVDAAPDPRPVVMFGVPPGVVFDPATGGAPAGEGEPRVVAGWAVGTLELPPLAPAAPPAAATGRVEALLVAPAAEAPMASVDRAEASPAGLAGDRYARGAGTFSAPGATGTALTLIEAEALDEVRLPGGGRISASQARRNVVTRGIELDGLIGRRFAVGEVECLGQRRCEPCRHLERLAVPGSLRALVHRGGLRADVVGPGTIAVGDPVRILG